MAFIDEEGIERCCEIWWKDFCYCTRSAFKASRRRKASKNKIPFGPYRGRAYYSLKSSYLISILFDGSIYSDDVKKKVMEVLDFRKCAYPPPLPTE